MTTKADQLIRRLEQLQTVSYEDPVAARVHHDNANAALCLIFHIGREQTTFTEEQRLAVAANLVAAIRPMQLNIENHSFEFRMRLNPLVLIKRSALQFLVDDYRKLPVPGNGTLSTVFKRVVLKETIEVLDEIIEEHRGELSSDDELAKEYHDELFGSDYNPSDYEFPGIPSSHSWWV